LYRVKEPNKWAIDWDNQAAESEVFLDPHEFDADGLAALGTTAWSKDGKYFAYALKRSGSDWSTIQIRNAFNKQDYSDKLERVKFSSIAWTHDNKGFFYSRYDDGRDEDGDVSNSDMNAQNTNKLQFQKLYYHHVGTFQDEDKLIYRNHYQPDWMYIPEISNDGKYLLINTNKDTANENLVAVADISDGISRSFTRADIMIRNLVPDFIGSFSYLHNKGVDFYFVTNF